MKSRASCWLGLAVLVLIAVLGGGCQTTDVSWNMTQSLSRSGGDIAMTALLDEGTDAKIAREYVDALILLIQDETLDKAALHDAAIALANKIGLKNAAAYIDALIAVIPSRVEEVNKIPADVRTALVSFLKDGALRAMDLYDPAKVKTDDDEN